MRTADTRTLITFAATKSANGRGTSSGDASVYPEAGAPWEIKKLYYEEIFNAERIRSLRRVVNELQPESPIRDEIEAIAERMQGREYTGTARLNVSDYFEIRDDALRAHAGPESRQQTCSSSCPTIFNVKHGPTRTIVSLKPG